MHVAKKIVNLSREKHLAGLFQLFLCEKKILFTNSIDAINIIHRNSLQSMQTFKVSCKAKIQKLLAFSARKPSSIIYIGILTTKVEESFITFYFF